MYLRVLISALSSSSSLFRFSFSSAVSDVGSSYGGGPPEDILECLNSREGGLVVGSPVRKSKAGCVFWVRASLIYWDLLVDVKAKYAEHRQASNLLLIELLGWRWIQRSFEGRLQLMGGASAHPDPFGGYATSSSRS